MAIQIIVDLEKACGLCDEYHSTVMQWDETSKTWVCTGICETGKSPMHAFIKGMEHYRRDKKKYPDLYKD